MSVELKIKIERDLVDKSMLVASMKTDDEIIAGYGKNPYDALRDLINSIQFIHQYFRADEE